MCSAYLHNYSFAPLSMKHFGRLGKLVMGHTVVLSCCAAVLAFRNCNKMLGVLHEQTITIRGPIYCCKTHTRAYLRHLFQARELQYFTLATLHNLARYLDIMHGIRQAILLGVFPQYLARVRAMAGETL